MALFCNLFIERPSYIPYTAHITNEEVRHVEQVNLESPQLSQRDD